MRFKELRGAAFALVLGILDMFLVFISVFSQDRTKLAIACVLSLMIVISVFMQYYIRFFDDGVLCYRSYLLALLPQFISYDEMLDVQLKGRHHICIETKKRKNHLYVWRGALLLEQLEKKRKSN